MNPELYYKYIKSNMYNGLVSIMDLPLPYISPVGVPPIKKPIGTVSPVPIRAPIGIVSTVPVGASVNVHTEHKCTKELIDYNECNINRLKLDTNANNTCTLGATTLSLFLPISARRFYTDLFLNSTLKEIRIRRNNTTILLTKAKLEEFRSLVCNYVNYIFGKNTGIKRTVYEKRLGVAPIKKDENGDDVYSGIFAGIFRNDYFTSPDVVYTMMSCINQERDTYNIVTVLRNKYGVNETAKISKSFIKDGAMISITEGNKPIPSGEFEIKKGVTTDVVIDWKIGIQSVLSPSLCFSICDHYPNSCNDSCKKFQYFGSPFNINPLWYFTHVYNDNAAIKRCSGFASNVFSSFIDLANLDLFNMSFILEEYTKIYFRYFFLNFYIDEQKKQQLIKAKTFPNEENFPKRDTKFLNDTADLVDTYFTKLNYLNIRYQACSNATAIASASIISIDNDENDPIGNSEPPYDLSTPALKLSSSNYVCLPTNVNKITLYELESVTMGLDTVNLCKKGDEEDKFQSYAATHHNPSGHTVMFTKCGPKWYFIDDELAFVRPVEVKIGQSEFINIDGSAINDASGIAWSVNSRDCVFMYKKNNEFELEVKQRSALTNLEKKQVTAVLQTAGFVIPQNVNASKYYHILLRVLPSKEIIGVAGADITTLELRDGAITPAWQGKNLYYSMLKYRMTWVNNNHADKQFYLFTEHTYLTKYHIKSGLTALSEKQTGEFIGENGLTYQLGNVQYFTFKSL